MREYLEELRRESARKKEAHEARREKCLMAIGTLLFALMFACFVWFSI